MKEIQTKSGDILCVEVPDLAFYVDWGYSNKAKDANGNSKIHIYYETEDNRIGGIITDFIENIQFNILGLLKDLTDSDVGKFVELTNTGLYKNYIWSDLKVKETCIQPLSNSAKQSFISLLQSEGVDVSKNIIVIEKL